MQPTRPLPQSSSPQRKLPHLPTLFIALLIVLVVAGFVGTLLVLGGRSHTHLVASGTDATGTTIGTPLPTTSTWPTATTTVHPIATTTMEPVATMTPVALQTEIRVTQNQDMRPLCVDMPIPYTVILLNAGNVNAHWQVVIPHFSATVAVAPPLMRPRSVAPYWASATPESGTIAPGQTASFVMNPLTGMPCGGASFHASVQLSVASVASQPDLPLTYTGIGPLAHSNVVLMGSQTVTEPCPTGGASPAPFIFALKNIGNGIAYPSIDSSHDQIGITNWATLSLVTDPTNPPVSSWLYPGETWTVTVAPSFKVQCGHTYHLYVYINNTQGEQSTLTFTDTFK